jgi:hypothetical protein
MSQTYDNLRVTSLTQDQHERTCNYWFTVTNGAMAHTAFESRMGLNRWLRERGLSLIGDLAEAGEWSTASIVGKFRTMSHMTEEEFERIGSTRDRLVGATAVMDNADYTLGKITEDEYGIRTVHYLNCNVKDRLVFEPRHTREVMR